MSYSAWAVCLVGLRMDQRRLQSVLFSEEQKRSCNCLKETPDSKYCPECGKMVWKTVYTPIEGYNERQDKLFGFTVEFLGSGRPAYISALRTACGIGSYDTLELNKLNLLEISTQMQEKLEPLGLWDAKAFGIHVFLLEG